MAILKAVPSLHPAYIIRDSSMAPATVSDYKKTLIRPPEYYNEFPSLGDVQSFTSKYVVLDIETSRYPTKVTHVGLSAKLHYAMSVPFRGPYISEVKRIIRDATEIVTHNGFGFDYHVLCEELGLDYTKLQADLHDTILAHHLCCPDQPHDLAYLGSTLTNHSAWKHLSDTRREYYNCKDTAITAEIWPQLRAILKQQGLWDTYFYVSRPIAIICKQMSKTGVKIDPTQIETFRERIKEEQKVLELQLPVQLKSASIACSRRILAPSGTRGKSGKPIKYITVPSSGFVVPWRSDKQVGQYLYTDLKLPEQKHVKTGKRTTDKIALDKLYRLSGQNPAIRAIKHLRSKDELLSTFAKEELQYSGSIHSSFSTFGTAQGRLSSSDPNMQNWPSAARCIVVPHHRDWTLVSFDYSQIESRLTAYLAHDTERIKRQNTPGFNEHKWAASVIFGIPMEEIEKDNSRDAPYGRGKMLNHGISYRLGARKIAKMYDLVEREVKEQQKKLLAAYNRTVAWQDYVAEEAKLNGVLTNAFGRKRWFFSPNLFTEAASFHGQSVAADIILRAMLGIMYEKINWPIEKAMKVVNVCKPLPYPAQLLLQVHDNLLFECPKGMVDQVVEIVLPVMEQKWDRLGGFSCPVAVEVGENWQDLEVFK